MNHTCLWWCDDDGDYILLWKSTDYTDAVAKELHAVSDDDDDDAGLEVMVIVMVVIHTVMLMVRNGVRMLQSNRR